MHKPADAGARVKPGVIALTALAMLCFAANSLLCRLALHDPSIDPASFTAIRILAGAATLAVLVAVRQRDAPRNLTTAGTWSGAAALFIYAAGFSFAYVSLGASVGALVLFGCVQTTMIAVGVARGERMAPLQITGALLAIAGLVYLLSPGLSAPPLSAPRSWRPPVWRGASTPSSAAQRATRNATRHSSPPATSCAPRR